MANDRMAIRKDLILLVLFLALPLAAAGSGGTTSGGSTLLFIVRGEASVIDDTLFIAPEIVEWFTYRPAHDAGPMSADALVHVWDDAFGDSPPNAAITGDGVDAVLILDRPSLFGRAIRFEYELIAGVLPEGDLGTVTLFIDSTGTVCSLDVPGPEGISTWHLYSYVPSFWTCESCTCDEWMQNVRYGFDHAGTEDFEGASIPATSWEATHGDAMCAMGPAAVDKSCEADGYTLTVNATGSCGMAGENVSFWGDWAGRFDADFDSMYTVDILEACPDNRSSCAISVGRSGPYNVTVDLPPAVCERAQDVFTQAYDWINPLDFTSDNEVYDLFSPSGIAEPWEVSIRVKVLVYGELYLVITVTVPDRSQERTIAFEANKYMTDMD